MITIILFHSFLFVFGNRIIFKSIINSCVIHMSSKIKITRVFFYLGKTKTPGGGSGYFLHESKMKELVLQDLNISILNFKRQMGRD